MSTKYQHQGGVRQAREGRSTPYRRVVQRGKAPRGARSLVWLAAIALGGVLLVFLSTQYERSGPRAFTPRQGVALVLEKRLAPDGARMLQLGILELGPETPPVDHAVSESVYDALAPGDRVAVLYRPGRRDEAPEVVEVGRFALPVAMQ